MAACFLICETAFVSVRGRKFVCVNLDCLCVSVCVSSHPSKQCATVRAHFLPMSTQPQMCPLGSLWREHCHGQRPGRLTRPPRILFTRRTAGRRPQSAGQRTQNRGEGGECDHEVFFFSRDRKKAQICPVTYGRTLFKLKKITQKNLLESYTIILHIFTRPSHVQYRYC